jgi:hypothetical protein
VFLTASWRSSFEGFWSQILPRGIGEMLTRQPFFG